MSDPSTPSQTVGPFFSIGLSWPEGRLVVPEGTRGAFWIRGHVLDGDGEPVPDALVETWQADERGAFALGDDGERPDALGRFRGFGRCPTNVHGAFELFTVKPGRVPDAAGTLQSPHLTMLVFARGLMRHLVTRVYFPDEDNRSDPLMQSLGRHEGRETLVARVAEDGYRFDVRLQGEHETVFFAI